MVPTVRLRQVVRLMCVHIDTDVHISMSIEDWLHFQHSQHVCAHADMRACPLLPSSLFRPGLCASYLQYGIQYCNCYPFLMWILDPVTDSASFLTLLSDSPCLLIFAVYLCYHPWPGLLTTLLPSDSLSSCCQLLPVPDSACFLVSFHLIVGPDSTIKWTLVFPQCITSCACACYILVLPGSCSQCLHLGTCVFTLPLQPPSQHKGLLRQELCNGPPSSSQPLHTCNVTQKAYCLLFLLL